MFDVDIRDTQPMRLAALKHKGAYTEIGATFDQLSALLSAQNLWPQTRGLAGVYFDEPTGTPADELESCAAVVVGEDFALPEGLTELRLPAGRHAVLTVEGPYSGLQAGYDHLYGQWFPNSGEEPDNAPPFELYLNTPADTQPANLRTEIHAPLRG